MENKLKVLSAYLPYGVKIECHTDEEIKEYGNCISTLTDVGVIGVGDNYGNNWEFTIKPILFPLEYLTKPITLYGETFVPIEVLKNIGYGINILNEDFDEWFNDFINSDFKLYEYSFVQKILEWKFNVFNLPEDEYVKVTDDFNPYK